ncbi:MAG TPA: signal recognition particle-docking protein FtsY [Kiritimatiellia bacterium]|nr:signal recognition particle-docking protein FtsY [Kiritimatiellia bacterium]HMO97960.1 signal recognition particle-docking protein FtsY [Kiritimatiellia bacterium]HMP95311.1 signal recognition particle-docking protein FtsY [Kiritimatiellia bacterium]
MNRWFRALGRTRQQFAASLGRLLGRTAALDAETLEELEARLLQADLPVRLTQEIVESLREQGVARGEDGIVAVRRRLLEVLGAAEPSVFTGEIKPLVVLMIGINGSGKTTSSAKLAARIKQGGLTPMLGAADTFRAAGSSQLKVWADRIGCEAITGAMGADAAAVAYDTLDAALARGSDVVIVDTAGRMHTKTPLMEELEKTVRSVAKRLPGAPHHAWIVLDASMGQNAINQARSFHLRVPLTGAIISKLDGSSKAGFVFSIRQELGIPIRYVGLGEGQDDLAPFDPEAFVDALLGVEHDA